MNTGDFPAYLPLSRQLGPWEQVPGLCVSPCAQTPLLSSGEPIQRVLKLKQLSWYSCPTPVVERCFKVFWNGQFPLFSFESQNSSCVVRFLDLTSAKPELLGLGLELNSFRFSHCLWLSQSLQIGFSLIFSSICSYSSLHLQDFVRHAGLTARSHWPCQWDQSFLIFPLLTFLSFEQTLRWC